MSTNKENKINMAATDSKNVVWKIPMKVTSNLRIIKTIPRIIRIVTKVISQSITTGHSW